ncbi:angiopoietin-related protein 2-like [Armigeres subalbatus]|uniref:angiopoietin-related protein 2-like n=1 Tax=Armigeres subalbatus TaxID=124917 RepID=UPI002ED094D1
MRILYLVTITTWYGSWLSFSQLISRVPQYYQSCNEAPNVSAIYMIRPRNNSAPFQAYCEQEHFGGHWLQFQNRLDGSTNFNRSWNDYKFGFGSLQREFWLGLEKLHRISHEKPCELLVVMANYSEFPVWYHYTTFGVANETDKYALKLLGFMEGTAGESFYDYRKENFSTYDRVNDKSGRNCAAVMGSGYWHLDCGTGSRRNNLNGVYGARVLDNGAGMWWGGFGGPPNPLKWSKMFIKVRPVLKTRVSTKR